MRPAREHERARPGGTTPSPLQTSSPSSNRRGEARDISSSTVYVASCHASPISIAARLPPTASRYSAWVAGRRTYGRGTPRSPRRVARDLRPREVEARVVAVARGRARSGARRRAPRRPRRRGSREHGAVGVAPQHLGVDDLLDGHDRPRARLREDPQVRPDDRRLDLDVAVRVGAVGVDAARRRARARGTRRALAGERVVEALEVLVARRSGRCRSGRASAANGRLRAPAPSRALSAVSENSSNPDRAPPRPPCGTAGRGRTLHRDRGADEAVDAPAAASQSTAMPPTRQTRPSSRFSWRISSRTSAIGDDWVRHVLQRDDVAVARRGRPPPRAS